MAVSGYLNSIGKARSQIIYEFVCCVGIASTDVPAWNKLRIRVCRHPKPNIASTFDGRFHARNVFLLRADKTPNFVDLQPLAREVLEYAILYQAAASPASTTNLLTVVLLTPVRRVIARMLIPSQRRWIILARSVFASLFILASMLER